MTIDSEQKNTTTPALLDGEFEIDKRLRPLELSDFVGQEKLKSNLSIFIQAAKERGGIARSCIALWSSRFGKNNTGTYTCQ